MWFLAFFTVFALLQNANGISPGDACYPDLQDWKSTGFSTYASQLDKCFSKVSPLASNPQKLQEVTVCMENSNPPTVANSNGFVNYSQPCANCFANYVICAVDNCSQSCAKVDSSVTCETCVPSNCGPAFLDCSGLDLSCRDGENCDVEVKSNLGLILGLCGAAVGLIGGAIAGYFVYRYRKEKSLHEEEIRRELALAREKRPADSVIKAKVEESLELPLKAIYAFNAEEEFEISLKQSEYVIGIKMLSDRWWLIRKGDGTVGMVPQNIVEEAFPDNNKKTSTILNEV